MPLQRTNAFAIKWSPVLNLQGEVAILLLRRFSIPCQMRIHIKVGCLLGALSPFFGSCQLEPEGSQGRQVRAANESDSARVPSTENEDFRSAREDSTLDRTLPRPAPIETTDSGSSIVETPRSETLAFDFDSFREAVALKYHIPRAEETSLIIDRLMSQYLEGRIEVAFDLALYLVYADAANADRDVGVSLLRQLAQVGDLPAMTELGRLHIEGLGVPRDLPEATALFEKAARKGDLEGTFLLSMMHSLRLAPDADDELARRLLERAVQAGHDKSARALFQTIIQPFEGIPFDALSGSDMERLRSELAMYPQLEDVFVQAANFHGKASDFETLSSFYHWTGNEVESDLNYTAAIEAGSFNFLEHAIENRFDMFADHYLEITRALLVHASEPGADGSRAAYWYAAFTAEAEHDLAFKELIVGLLEQGTSQDGFHAPSIYALQLIEDGTRPREALRKARALSVEEAYVRVARSKARAKVATSGMLNVDPVVIHLEPAAYPPELYAERLEGNVLVEGKVDIHGNIVQVRAIESSHPGFEQAAIDSFSKTRCEPGMKDGQPVTTRVRMRISFSP